MVRQRNGYYSWFIILLVICGLLFLGVSPPVNAGVATQYDIPLYLAEGCTRSTFATWLCVLNLHEKYPFTLKVEYATPAGIIKTVEYHVKPNSRFTVNVNTEIGPEQDVSLKMLAIPAVDNPAPQHLGSYIMVERPVYFNYNGVWDGGHVNTASAVPLPTRQYFAEGTTRQGFDQYICVLNPNAQATKLTFNYMIQGEGLQVVEENIPANSRQTYFVPNHLGRGKDVSLELVSGLPVVAERPMYFAYKNMDNGMICTGGHVITGARQADANPHTFAFAPMSFVPGMGWANTWVCLQNPNTEVAPVNVWFSTTTGIVHTQMHLPPQQRMTFYYPALMTGYASKEPGAFRVQAADPALPIMVERPVYMNIEFGGISDGTVTSGDSAPTYAQSYNKYAEGHTGDGFTTWMALTVFETSYPGVGLYLNTCYFPGEESIGVNVDCAEVGRAIWEVTLWRVNNQFPATDIAFRSNGFYAERIMVFTYSGGWKGLHSSVGCPHTQPGL